MINLADKKSIHCPYCGLPMIWTFERDDIIGDYPVCFCDWCKITIKAENDSPYMNDDKTAEYLVDKLIDACKPKGRSVKVKKRQICTAWEKGHWFCKDMDTCNGTREREPCSCKGNTQRCDFYPEKRKIPSNLKM